VRGVFCAHSHSIDMTVHDGIPYFTLPSPIEKHLGPNQPCKAFTVVDVTPKQLQVRIFGEDSKTFVFSPDRYN
jgi:hypothetical protein